MAAVGAVAGGAVALAVNAPASWLASALAGASNERVLLADARGSVWNGSAVAVLGGGPGSRDASALPGRLRWSLGWSGGAPALVLRQDCCIAQPLPLRVDLGLGRWRVALPAKASSAAA
jgi:general secretion pathway protein N